MSDDKIIDLSNQYLKIINQIFDNQQLSAIEKFRLIASAFTKFLKISTNSDSRALPDTNHKIQFATNASRIQFLISKYNLEPEFIRINKLINYYKKKFTNSIPFEKIEEIKELITKFLEAIIKPESDVETILSKKIDIPSDGNNKIYKFIKFETNTNKNLLTCLNENFEKIQIILDSKFDFLKYIPNIETLLYISGIEPIENSKNKYKQTLHTKIIIEPGFIVDVTDVADCFTLQKNNPYYYFKKLLFNSPPNIKLVKGTLTNSIFDSVILDPAIDFETAFRAAVKYKPLSLIAALLNENGNGNNSNGLKSIAIELKSQVYQNFLTIKNVVPSFETGNYIIEPSFISESNGIQGRLDLMIEKNEFEKDVIELKAGTFPKNNLRVNFNIKDPFINTWINHNAQANSYNILLDDIFNNRRGNSTIFYCSDNQKPLRNVPNEQTIKNIIILVRNQIINIIKNIIARKTDFETIVYKLINDPSLLKFSPNLPEVIDNLEIGEWQYLNELFFHIVLEDYLVRMKNNLIRSDIALNEHRIGIDDENFQINTSLKIDYDQSDFENNHLLLYSDGTEINFREGDLVVLYPDEFTSQPTKFFIIKGSVREVKLNSIMISLLNKSIDINFFKKFDKWTLEIDNSDDQTRRYFRTFNIFLNSPKHYRKKVINGCQNTYSHLKIPKFKYLNNKQQKIVSRAINHNEYFLIQGPPGTGKTSRILRAIVEYYYKHTNKKILLLAFTKRAVEEICETLDKIETNFPFLRISSKSIENYKERSIPFISEEKNINDLMKLILNTRVFVGTVTATNSYLEILDIVKFDLVILDEASQVMDPQINGILSSIPKFILIGDVNQLPAISIVDESYFEGKKYNFNTFSRLLENSRNQINEPIGHLQHQGRMHKQIQEFANHLTYSEKLYTITKSQLAKDNKFKKYGLQHRWLSSRIVFIDTPLENEIKSNKYQIELISTFIKYLYKKLNNHFTPDTIGVVSPFKRQSLLIRDALPQEIADKVTIDTVERFQGSERDIIIYSFAVNHQFMLDKISSIVNLDDKIVDRKFNVATTRARENLILLGNIDLLSLSPYYKNAIDWIASNGKIFRTNT